MYCINWNSYRNNICNGFAQLQQREEFVDMTLVAEGHLVKVHKNLISLASPYIKNVIKSVPCTHPIIFLANITHDVLCQLLEYIYTGEVHVEIDKLNEFIKAAKELQLPTITNDLPHTTNLVSPLPPKNAATDSNNDILQTNIPSLQNVNNNDLAFTTLGSGNINNNATEDLLIPKIQILSNRQTDCVPSDAAIKINANDVILDIDMAVLDNDNNDHSLPLATNLLNGQSTNTPEALPTVNKIQILENRLLSSGMSEAATETNDMNNILVTKDTSSQNDVDNHYDYSHSVVVTEIDDANNFEDLLKFPDPPNSIIIIKEHSLTDQQTQESEIIDHTSQNNEENNKPQLEFSLDLSINSLPQYTVSNRGSLQLVLNRYLYSMHYSANHGSKRRWRCIDYRALHCKAFVDTLNDKIIKRKNCHVHPRHDSKIVNKITANLIFGTVDRAEQETKKITSWRFQ